MAQATRSELEERIKNASKRKDEAWEAYVNLPIGDPHSYEAFQHYQSVAAEHSALIDEEIADIKHSLEDACADLVFQAEGFHRPQRGFFGLMSRKLGPLPNRPLLVHPTQEELAALPSYRVLAPLLLVGAIGLLIAFAVFAPWLAVSPVMLLIDAYSSMFGSTIGMVVAIVVALVLMSTLPGRYKTPSYKGKLIDKLAMFEEQWFRMGAESWTTRQRIYSCAAFGTVHITNMIYPMTSVLVLMLVGAVFMAVYLREYRLSGDTKRATLAAAKFHATYNRFAFLYMIAAFTILVVVQVSI